MGLGFIRRTARRAPSRAGRRSRAGRFFPASPVVVRSWRSAISGTGSLTATFVQVHVMAASLTGTGTLAANNGSTLTAVTLKAPQINPSAITIRIP